MRAETQDDKKKELELQKKLHLERAEQARSVLQFDQQKASEDTYVCTFDLQKALPFPKLSTSVAYYKRNLYVYNFGYTVSIPKQGLCMFGMKPKVVEVLKK